jgi:hypothetical protein
MAKTPPISVSSPYPPAELLEGMITLKRRELNALILLNEILGDAERQLDAEEKAILSFLLLRMKV